MNEHDSEIMAGLLEQRGYVPVADVSDAAVEIINTCSVRDNADSRFFGTLGQLKKRKKEDPWFTVCICGCMMQQERVTEIVKQKYPWVDLIFGTHNIGRLPELLVRAQSDNDILMEVWQGREDVDEDYPSDRLFKMKALVNIMYGCNNFCSYCVVPYTRGREVSRPAANICSEVENLAGDGVKEIMLLGQNVNSYRAGKMNFTDLLRMIERVDGIERIRFMTSHPKDISYGLIEFMAKSEKMCKYLHLPLQSGSDAVLSRMNRRYSAEKYRGIIDALRNAMPDITISTDIIVGFPGESEEDFRATLDMVEYARYDSAFTFIYSPRPGTPAALMDDQIPDDVSHERFNRLVDAVNRISLEKNREYIGSRQRILVEGRSKRNMDKLRGRTDGFKLVNFTGSEELIGEFADVDITDAKTFSLEGRIKQ